MWSLRWMKASSEIISTIGIGLEGVWVLGLDERTIARKIIFVSVKKRYKKTLSKKIKKFTSKGSVFYTDKWNGYNGASEGFVHLAVDHSQNPVYPITRVHTQTIEGNWCGIKQDIPKKFLNKKNIKFNLLLKNFRRKWRSKFHFLIGCLFFSFTCFKSFLLRVKKN